MTHTHDDGSGGGSGSSGVSGIGGDDGADDPGATGDPACGGTDVHDSTVPDMTLPSQSLVVDAPPVQLAILGKVWTGTVSFELDRDAPCARVFGDMYDAGFRIVDGNNRQLPVTTGPSTVQYRNVKLPVTLTETAGIGNTPNPYTGPFCAPAAYLKNIHYETIGTACMNGPEVRARFTDWIGNPEAVLDADLGPTTMTFSASATFYANYSAPECANVRLIGQDESLTLDDAMPSTAGQIEMHPPITVVAIPTCQSSPESPPEATDADFDLKLSTIELSPPGE